MFEIKQQQLKNSDPISERVNENIQWIIPHLFSRFWLYRLLSGKHWKFDFVRSHSTKWQARDRKQSGTKEIHTHTHTHTHTPTPSMNIHYPGLRLLSQHISRKQREIPADLDPLQAWSKGRYTVWGNPVWLTEDAASGDKLLKRRDSWDRDNLQRVPIYSNRARSGGIQEWTGGRPGAGTRGLILGQGSRALFFWATPCGLQES